MLLKMKFKILLNQLTTDETDAIDNVTNATTNAEMLKTAKK